MKEFFETLFIVAGIQGLLLSVMLFTRKNNHSANIVLAISSMLLSFDLFNVLFYSKGIYLVYPHMIGVFYPLPFVFGPLFYIYTKLITKKEEGFSNKNLLHFLPALVVYLISMPVFISSGPEKIEFVSRMMNDNPPFIHKAINYVIPFQGLIYTFFTVKIVLEYNDKIKSSFSNIDKINLNWLKHVAVSMIVIWSIVAVLYLVRSFVSLIKGLEVILPTSIAVLIYSVGYRGLKQPEIFMPSDTLPQPQPQQQQQASAKYQKSGLRDDSAEDIKQKLLDTMLEEKPYLDSELTLVKLSEVTGISVHNLSEVINSRLKQSYFDFINSYRVEEFKMRLLDPANSSFSLIGIAYDSGFNSKTTFYKIFKKFTNMTPSEFKSISMKTEAGVSET